MMYIMMLNLIYFTVCSLLYFEHGKELTHSMSWLFFSLGFLLFGVTFVKFHFEPVFFGEFNTSFRKQTLASKHYFIQIITLILSVVLLGTVTSLPYLALIPSVLMIIFTIAYKPYEYKMQNYRSAFNYTVMCSWIILKTMIQRLPVASPSMLIFYILNTFGLLTIVIILSLTSILYYYYYENYIKPKEDLCL